MKRSLLVSTGLILIIATACGPQTKDVRIAVALPPKLDLTDYDTLYFPGFITEDEGLAFDPEREALNFLRREFKLRSGMSIVNRSPLDLSDKDPRSFFAKDQPFFRELNMPQSNRALALTGVIAFESVDRSGFREIRDTDYITGRIRTRTQYVEITGFNLNMRVYVYELSGGRLIYSDVLQDSAEVPGASPDEKLVLYDLMERVSDRVLGLFSNTLVRAERSLL